MIESFLLIEINLIFFNRLYSMKIKEQTRKLAVGCSKQCFEELTKSVTIPTAR